MTFAVIVTQGAENDLLRLFDFLLQRELDSDTGDFELPRRAIQAIQNALVVLEHSPFTCRKAGGSSFIRELIIPFGHTGYLALFEITDHTTVSVFAVRHQREDDYF
jgi:plasmid stabilization system protein ParE